MADETRDQGTEPRRPMADPRLQREGRKLSALQIAAQWSGWVAAVLLVALLLWLAVNSSFILGQKILLGVTIALAVFWGVVHRDSLMGATRTRGMRIGANSAIFVLFVLGIIVLLNVVAARQHWRADVTENQRFSLSEQTRAIVSGLEQDLEMVAFLTSDSPQTPEVSARLREYEMLSPKIKLSTYDPLLDAEKAIEYDVRSTTSNVVVVKLGEQQETVYGGEEEQLTSTILALSSGEKARVCFLTGHGELSLEDAQGTGLGTIKSSLENQQYEVETLNLSTEEEPSVPGDCAALIIAGPTEPIRQEEMEAIVAYAQQGGNLMVALEIGGPDFAELLEPYGLRARDGMVYDRSYGFLGAAEIPMAQQAGQHMIVERLPRVALAFPTTRALEIVDTSMQDPMAPGMPPTPSQAQPLLETSPSAWLERPVAAAEGEEAPQPQEDPGETRGPLTLAAVVDAGQGGVDPMTGMPAASEETGARIVVMGDAEMMTDQFIGLGLVGNAHFVLNSVNWLMENEKLITIPPKDDMPRYLTLTTGQQRLVWALTVGIIPLAIGLAGFIVWWRRR